MRRQLGANGASLRDQCGAILYSAAQFNLASLYREGRGVPPDPLEAFAWANAASELREFRSQKLLESVAKQMTSAQIKQAQQRSAQYRQKYVATFRKH